MFASYDREHDGDLYDRLVEQASRSGSRFELVAHSATRGVEDHWDQALRDAIRRSDAVIVVCGASTDASGRMGAELRTAQEEDRPYLLVWGRREAMCTRPTTARPTDSMYSWTPEILEREVLSLHRKAEATERAAARRAERDAGDAAP